MVRVVNITVIEASIYNKGKRHMRVILKVISTTCAKHMRVNVPLQFQQDLNGGYGQITRQQALIHTQAMLHAPV
jgi:hypothetical protein